MAELEDLPAVVQEAIDNKGTADTLSDIERERIKVERERIKSEERVMERQAERDENVAKINSGVDEYRSLFDDLFGRLNSLLSSSTPSVAVDVSHEQHEIPAPASEDIPPEPVAAVEEVPESVEEIGGETENTGETVEKGIDNAEPGNTERRRKKRRRK